ncbi:MAG: hypothetical protein ACREPG_00185 [Candidatus Binatia bacterium]
MAARTPEIFGLPWWFPVGGIAALIMFPQIVGKLGFRIGRTAITVVIDAATGAVIAIGESVGIPATDAAKCKEYVDAGDFWQASFYCPAGTFLKEAGGAVVDTVTGAIVAIAPPSPSAEIIALQTEVTPEQFQAWLQATGGVLKPGQTQKQAAWEWLISNRYTPSVMDFPPDTTIVLPGTSPGEGQVSDWPAA